MQRLVVKMTVKMTAIVVLGIASVVTGFGSVESCKFAVGYPIKIVEKS